MRRGIELAKGLADAASNSLRSGERIGCIENVAKHGLRPPNQGRKRVSRFELPTFSLEG